MWNGRGLVKRSGYCWLMMSHWFCGSVEKHRWACYGFVSFGSSISDEWRHLWSRLCLGPHVTYHFDDYESKSAIWKLFWNFLLLMSPQQLLKPYFANWSRRDGWFLNLMSAKMFVPSEQSGYISAWSWSLLLRDTCLISELERPLVCIWNSEEITLKDWTALISETRPLLYEWTTWYLCPYWKEVFRL